jgi:predicted amidophosphoribosyltransferase
MFCWAVKSGEYHGDFYIERKAGRLNITRNNFQLVRPTFGAWAARMLPTFSDQSLLVVPVPSKAALVGVETYASLEMAQQAMRGTDYQNCVLDGLRWTKKLQKAHEGGPRKRADLLSLLEVTSNVNGKQIVLIDDLFTTGGSLLACHDRLNAAGATVLGAITCGRTVYDTAEPPFKAREFELKDELSDYRG